MSHFETKPVDPLKAPWAPGVTMRSSFHPTLGVAFQLHDGAALPRSFYMRLHRAAEDTQGSQVCPN